MAGGWPMGSDGMRDFVCVCMYIIGIGKGQGCGWHMIF